MDAKKNLIVDVTVLAVYAVAANPGMTGVGVHEWIGVGVLLLFAVRVAQHGDWVAETLRAMLRRPLRGRAGRLLLDTLILLALAVCAVSGLLISGAVLPAAGCYALGYYFWDPLHAISAKVLLALLLVHVVVHARWLASFMRKGEGDEGEEHDG